MKAAINPQLCLIISLKSGIAGRCPYYLVLPASSLMKAIPYKLKALFRTFRCTFAILRDFRHARFAKLNYYFLLRQIWANQRQAAMIGALGMGCGNLCEVSYQFLVPGSVTYSKL